jgi:hypothetical protein
MFYGVLILRKSVWTPGNSDKNEQPTNPLQNQPAVSEVSFDVIMIAWGTLRFP